MLGITIAYARRAYNSPYVLSLFLLLSIPRPSARRLIEYPYDLSLTISKLVSKIYAFNRSLDWPYPIRGPLRSQTRGFPIKHNLGKDPAAASFIQDRNMIRNDTTDAIKLAQAKMAARYDASEVCVFFGV